MICSRYCQASVAILLGSLVTISCGSEDEGDSSWGRGGSGAGADAAMDSTGNGGAAGGSTGGSAGAGGATAGSGGEAGQDASTAGSDASAGGSDAGLQDVSQELDAVDPPTDAPPGCQPVKAAAPVDPWKTRLPAKGFGGITPPSASGAHSDVFLSSPAPSEDLLRIGARLDWGGSIVFFGLTANPSSNVIDANDTGRELQIALYDPTRIMQGCAWNASCQTTPSACASSITFLGWNPVQGGDECGHGSTAEWQQAGDSLRIITHPLQWNPDWDKQDCTQSACGPVGVPVAVTYVTDLTFVSTHVVEVAMELQSQESFSHPVTVQEFPTLYVEHGQSGPDLSALFDSAGTQIALTTPANDGFFVGDFDSPGPWVTWQKPAKDYGVGLAMDQGIRKWQGWRGDGNPAPYFHNVRARIEFGLPSNKIVRGVSYLALGSFATVKAELEGALSKRPPFGVLDAPTSGGAVSVAKGSAVPISGWVLDTQDIEKVAVLVDGQLAVELPVNGARPDVCSVYPAYAGCPNVGYAGDLQTAGWDDCPHLVRVTARDSEGNETVLGESAVQAQ